MDLNSFILLLTFTVNIGLGIFIYFRNRLNQSNRSFAAFLFCVAIWTLSFFIFQNTKSLEWILFARRLTPVGSSLIAGYFLFFTLIFPKEKQDLSNLTKMIVLLPGFAFSFLSLFSGLMIESIMVTDLNRPFLGRVSFGPAYRLFSIYFMFYFTLAIVNLIKKYIRSEGLEKLQIFYVLFGAAIAGLLGMTTSLILPLWGISTLFTAGPPFTLIMVAFITYAMVKHKLLNVTDFLSRGLMVLGVVAILVGTTVLILTGGFIYLPLFFMIVTNIILGILVLVRSPRSHASFSFFGLTLGVAAWSYSIFRYWVSATGGEALFWGVLANASAAFIPSFFLHFTIFFPRPEKLIIPLFKISLLYLPALILSISCFFNLVIKDVTVINQGYTVVPGPLFAPYMVFFIAYFLYSFYLLVQKHNHYTGMIRMQIRYVFIGSLISCFCAVITNLVMPFFGNSSLTTIGPYFIVIFVAFTSYAILKHRLMSIEVVIQRSTVYAVVAILIMAFYALAVMVSEIYLRKVIGYTSLLVTASAALLIAVAYQPLVRGLQNFTDRLFFRGRYDYQKTLREISHRIAAVIKLEELTKLIVSSFIDTMKVSEISFLLPEKEREHFRSVALTLPRYKKIEIDVKSPIVSWLSAVKDILVRDEIEDEIGRQEALGREGMDRKKALEEVRDEMDRLGISIWVPVVSKEELIGIIALGSKLSGDIFTSEDLGLLSTLASQTAVALDNARLYDEVVTMKDYNEEILQSMTNGVLTTDTRGRVVTYNYMAERITGRKGSEVLGKTCEEVWGKRGAITVAIENALKDRCYLNFETSIASPERGLVPVSFSSTLLRDGHGKKMAALLSIQDLSEVKELEDKVRRADKLTALATMAAGMAHEIKNPLSSMKVFSQLLPKKFDDPEYRKKLEEILPREIDRIDRIVESLLGFARATAPTFEKARIEEVLEETLKYYEEQARNAGVVVKKGYAQLPEVEVDRSQISQVFSNLILNALQAMPEGGELSVETLPGKKVDDLLQSVKIKIADTGHGIPEDMQKKLFDPFFTTKYGGTGLGLTIAHSIVDGHKGFIDVESRVGKGTTFVITLPVFQGLV